MCFTFSVIIELYGKKFTNPISIGSRRFHDFTDAARILDACTKSVSYASGGLLLVVKDEYAWNVDS